MYSFPTPKKQGVSSLVFCIQNRQVFQERPDQKEIIPLTITLGQSFLLIVLRRNRKEFTFVALHIFDHFTIAPTPIDEFLKGFLGMVTPDLRQYQAKVRSVLNFGFTFTRDLRYAKIPESRRS